MEYEKTLLYPKMSKMPSVHCSLPSTPITSALTSFKVGQPVNNSPYLHLADTYAAYANNFDLSLLPQECNNDTDDIPTTVYQYSGSNNDNQTPITPQTPHSPPQIKIEQTWSNQLSADEFKQEPAFPLSYDQLIRHQQQQQQQQQHHQQQQICKSSNQLIPPPAYPHLYPSPQSSPAQSEYAFPQSQYTGCYESLSSSRTSLYAASPCPSLDTHCIKQELHILPPSPPESNCEAPSPHSACSDIKSEPFDADVEALIDLNSLFEKPQGNFSKTLQPNSPNLSATTPTPTVQQDHQLLREYLEDTTFQRKHNLKPLALDSFIGGLEAVRGDIEPVISLALEHAKREADEICAKLQISQDPSAWSSKQVHSWLRSTLVQFKLPQIIDLETKFHEDGAALILLSEDEFTRRAPECGSTLHAQLEVWRMSFSDRWQIQSSTDQQLQFQEPQINESNASASSEPAAVESSTNDCWEKNCTPNFNMDVEEDSDDDDDDTLLPLTSTSVTASSTATSNATEPKRATTGGRSGSHIHLWQFLKELLSTPHVNGTAIRWIDRSKGIFKIEDSVRVAKLWGRRKNRPAMNYDKLSRSIRQYYKKGIMKKTERSQRLVYQFCHPYHL